jgi:hypothetical protein
MNRIARYFGNTGTAITSLIVRRVPIPEAAVVCSNCSARSSNERLELEGG